MYNFIFQNATKVYFGKGCVKEYLSCLIENANTVLLAYGGGSIRRNGVYDEIIGILKDAGKSIVEFSGIMSNPTYAKVQEGAKLARDNQADLILAVGGGSVMDCCKAVALAARYGGDIWDDFWARPGVIDFEPLPLGVVVTVAGTGSECNGGAVITNEEKKVKTGRDYPKLNPRFALMDPTYTFSVSKKQMASGSFDILSHIMETYFSEPNEDNVSDDIMEALMRSVVRNLRAAMDNPEDYTARSNLMWDSTMAENRLIKMGKKCGFECHNMEHQLGAYTNCNHGCGRRAGYSDRIPPLSSLRPYPASDEPGAGRYHHLYGDAKQRVFLFRQYDLCDGYVYFLYYDFSDYQRNKISEPWQPSDVGGQSHQPDCCTGFHAFAGDGYACAVWK